MLFVAGSLDSIHPARCRFAQYTMLTRCCMQMMFALFKGLLFDAPHLAAGIVADDLLAAAHAHGLVVCFPLVDVPAGGDQLVALHTGIQICCVYRPSPLGNRTSRVRELPCDGSSYPRRGLGKLCIRTDCTARLGVFAGRHTGVSCAG